MKAILIDDEKAAINYLARMCEQISYLEVIEKFTDGIKALDYIRKNNIDIVFLDIEMPGLNGIEIAKEIQTFSRDTNVIFVTAYEHYAFEAFKVDAISYILKPCEVEEIEKALYKVKRYSTYEPQSQKVYVQTFDRFDVFVNDCPIYFANAKAKELLALLIDRQGSIVTMEQVADLLWGDRIYDENVKQLYRKAVSYLNKVLSKNDIHFFVSKRGSCYIEKSQIKCDLYDLWEGDLEAINKFSGYYMLDYAWGEETIAKIEKVLIRNRLSVL